MTIRKEDNDLVSGGGGGAANNQIAADASGDVCAKSLLACTLRNNQIHFGGFPGTGLTIPRS